MNSLDLIIYPIYFIGTLFIAWIFFRLRIKNTPLANYFFPALIFKLLCGLVLGMLFYFYYGYGDTFVYFRSAQRIVDAFGVNMTDGFRMLLLGQYLPEYNFPNDILASHADSFLMYRITALASILGFKQYTAVGIFFSLFSFLGSWKLSNTLHSIHPHLKKPIVISFLFFPSVIFWGSGILVDALCVGFLGFLYSSFVKIIYKKGKFIKQIIIIIICAYFLNILKNYIFYAFLGMLAIYLFYLALTKIPSKALKFLFISSTASVGIVLFFAFYTPITMGITDIMFKMFLERALRYQQDVRSISSAGASYELISDVQDVNFAKILSISPRAIGTAIFRPFLWESSSVIQLVSGFENFIILLFSIWVVIKTGFIQTIRLLFSNKLFFAIFVFTLIFAFSVGIASGNFGALSRYRIPFMPFYFYLLGYLFFNGRSAQRPS